MKYEVGDRLTNPCGDCVIRILTCEKKSLNHGKKTLWMYTYIYESDDFMTDGTDLTGKIFSNVEGALENWRVLAPKLDARLRPRRVLEL